MRIFHAIKTHSVFAKVSTHRRICVPRSWPKNFLRRLKKLKIIISMAFIKFYRRRDKHPRFTISRHGYEFLVLRVILWKRRGKIIILLWYQNERKNVMHPIKKGKKCFSKFLTYEFLPCSHRFCIIILYTFLANFLCVFSNLNEYILLLNNLF